MSKILSLACMRDDRVSGLYEARSCLRPYEQDPVSGLDEQNPVSGLYGQDRVSGLYEKNPVSGLMSKILSQAHMSKIVYQARYEHRSCLRPV